MSIRLLLWILLETSVLALVTLSNGWPDVASMLYLHNYGIDAAGFFLVSIDAAWMALRNSIPSRETGTTELTLLLIGVATAPVIVRLSR